MNNTLKQLQEKGEEEFRNKFFVLYDSDMSGMGTDQVDNVLDFLHQQTTLAFEAGKAEALAMVLKEKQEMKDTHICRFNDSPQICNCYLEALDNIETKLTAKGEVKGFHINATETPMQGTQLTDFIPGGVSKFKVNNNGDIE